MARTRGALGVAVALASLTFGLDSGTLSGASSIQTTYYACLKAGTLSQVSKAKHSCPKGSQAVSGLFAGANFTGANLVGANLTGANLIKANLTGSNLTNANLTSAIFIEANLTGVNFSGAYLVHAIDMPAGGIYDSSTDCPNQMKYLSGGNCP